MQRDPIREVLVAIAFFGALAALAWMEGVFERLGTTTIALAFFAFAFAVMTVWLDRDLRRAVGNLDPRLRGDDPLDDKPLRKSPAKSPAAKQAAT